MKNELNQKTTITEENGQWSAEIQNGNKKTSVTINADEITIEAETIRIL